MNQSYDPFESMDSEFNPGDPSERMSELESRLKRMRPRPLQVDFDSIIDSKEDPSAETLVKNINKSTIPDIPRMDRSRFFSGLSRIAASWLFGAIVGGSAVYMATQKEDPQSVPIVSKERPSPNGSSRLSPSISDVQPLADSPFAEATPLEQFLDPRDETPLQAGSLIRPGRKMISKRSDFPMQGTDLLRVPNQNRELPSTGNDPFDAESLQQIPKSREELMQELLRGT